MMNATQWHQYLVKLALEAHDATATAHVGSPRSQEYRTRFRTEVTERMAQAAQTIACDLDTAHPTPDQETAMEAHEKALRGDHCEACGVACPGFRWCRKCASNPAVPFTEPTVRDRAPEEDPKTLDGVHAADCAVWNHDDTGPDADCDCRPDYEADDAEMHAEFRDGEAESALASVYGDNSGDEPEEGDF